MIEFSDDEAGYRSWIGSNPTGYVVNQRWNGKHLVLHEAGCTWVNQPVKHTNSDAQSTKICGTGIASLIQDVENKYRKQPDRCKVCGP